MIELVRKGIKWVFYKYILHTVEVAEKLSILSKDIEDILNDKSGRYFKSTQIGNLDMKNIINDSKITRNKTNSRYDTTEEIICETEDIQKNVEKCAHNETQREKKRLNKNKQSIDELRQKFNLPKHVCNWILQSWRRKGNGKDIWRINS